MLNQVLVLTVIQHGQGAWAPAEFSSSSLPGVTSVPANQVDGVGWWEVAKNSSQHVYAISWLLKRPLKRSCPLSQSSSMQEGFP